MVQSFRPSFVTSTFPSETQKQRYIMRHNAIQIALLFSCLIVWMYESPLPHTMCVANKVSVTKWSRWWVSEGFYFTLGEHPGRVLLTHWAGKEKIIFQYGVWRATGLLPRSVRGPVTCRSRTVWKIYLKINTAWLTDSIWHAFRWALLNQYTVDVKKMFVWCQDWSTRMLFVSLLPYMQASK